MERNQGEMGEIERERDGLYLTRVRHADGMSDRMDRQTDRQLAS